MNTKTIAVIAALDTKGAEASFVADIVRQRGHRPLMIDVGVQAHSLEFEGVSSREVAQAGGAELDALRTQGNKGVAMEVMTRGAAVISAQLHTQGKFDAIIGIGGTAGTAIGSSAMRALPIGIPKVLLSTVASGDTRAYVGTEYIIVMSLVPT